MNIIDNTLEYYIYLLKSKTHFSLTRWGDGEWSCALGLTGSNCDGHEYFPEMADGLREALLNDKGYFKATWPLTVPMFSKISPLIEDSIRINEIDSEWVDARIWEEAAIAGKIEPLIQQMENMDFILVSDNSKKDFPIKYFDFIEIPAVNCFLEKDRIIDDILNITNKKKDILFAFSASMATNVIVDELYPTIGKDCWMIDFGSIWEPYIGKFTRSYHHRYENLKLK